MDIKKRMIFNNITLVFKGNECPCLVNFTLDNKPRWFIMLVLFIYIVNTALLLKFSFSLYFTYPS